MNIGTSTVYNYIIILLSPSIVPTAAVQNVIVSDVSSTGLTVSWEAPPLSHQNGPITVYSILISAVNSSYSRSVTSLALTVDITGLHPNYEYTVSVTAESNSGSGIASSPIMFTTLQARKYSHYVLGYTAVV